MTLNQYIWYIFWIVRYLYLLANRTLIYDLSYFWTCDDDWFCLY